MSLATTVTLTLLAGFLVGITLLPLLPSDIWWVRCWEFPRVQIAVLSLAVAIAVLVLKSPGGTAGKLLSGALLVATAYHVARILPYTPLAPTQVAAARAGGTDAHPRIAVMMSNVLMHNRQAEKLLALVEQHQPDVLLAVETDSWWQDALTPLTESLPHQVAVPQDDTYGMLLFSRHPLTSTTVEYLVSSHIPSIHTTIGIPGSPPVRFHAVHPEPPAPSEADDTTERDAELLIVGRRAAEEQTPVIVAGDLNDVAWSPTTTLFQKTSHLLDPRRGRGLYSSFHAGYPFLRWPLDHLFHSDHFSLVSIQRLPPIGSDHFPILVELAFEPGTPPDEEPPSLTPEEEAQATEKIEAADPR